MRKLLKWYIKWNIVMWLLTLLTIMFMYAEKLDSRPILVLLGSAVISIGVLTLLISVNIDSMGLNKDWFKTQKELEELREETKKSWTKAQNMRTILGNHEAIKLYKEQHPGTEAV